MRTTITAAFCLVLAAAGAAAQDKKDASALPKKGDTIVLNGCLRGGALEATDVSAGEDAAATPLLSGQTFRLTGKKDLLKDMKEKHDGRLVEVRGRLKSDLQAPAGYGAKLGGMRITIGGPASGASARDAANQQSLPVVEVSTYQGTGTSCAR
jgi:hypothetical protein